MKIDISRIRKILGKLKSKDPVFFIRVQKKIKQIASDESPLEHFKNLRHDLSDYKRVQIGSFILLFRLEEDKVIFECFKHHDEAYKR